ncbi:MAG: hypothetical protein ABL999_14770 [Pyrinomonadaceae bacterium]
MSALLFLGLIDDKGIPQDELDRLVSDKENRKGYLKAILLKKFENLFAADLTRVSPSQFESLFSSDLYNVHGDTRKKARAFFFGALDYTGTAYSKLLTQRIRSPRKKKPEANGAASMAGSGAVKKEADVSKEKSHGAIGGDNDNVIKAMKIITLADSGKIVWLGSDANVLELKKGRDREFILALNDLFDEYEAVSKESQDESASLL